jgi:hypothetical protein
VKQLGAWRINDPLWPWYFNPVDELLYEKCGDDWWVYAKMPSHTRRLLYHMKSRALPPSLCRKVLVQQHDDHLVCLSHGLISMPHCQPPIALQEEISMLPQSAIWGVSSFTATDNGTVVVSTI